MHSLSLSRSPRTTLTHTTLSPLFPLPQRVLLLAVCAYARLAPVVRLTTEKPTPGHSSLKRSNNSEDGGGAVKKAKEEYVGATMHFNLAWARMAKRL